MCYFQKYEYLSSLFMIFCFIDETCKCYEDGCSSYTFNVKSTLPDWEKSRKLCKKTGLSDLVSIESDAEWTFLKNIILNLTKADDYFIGLKKDEKSGKWRWLSNKSTMNTLRWATGEPNDDGNCTVMYKDYRRQYGKYNDVRCRSVSARFGYICERPVDSCDQEGMSYIFYALYYRPDLKRLQLFSTFKLILTIKLSSI